MLRAVLQRFAEDVNIRYDLACYACKLGKPKDAMDYLERAIELASPKDIRLKALDDPAFENLWVGISEM
jgi:hypothetical protein